MDTQELNKMLAGIIEKGFDNSFSEFCAKTFASFQYPPEKLAAARMHSFYLRCFIEEYLSGESSGETEYCKVGLAAFEELEKSERPTAMEYCRAFVEKWCRFCAGE